MDNFHIKSKSWQHRVWMKLWAFLCACILLLGLAISAVAQSGESWKLISKWANGEVITAYLDKDGNWKVIASSGTYWGNDALENELRKLQTTTTKSSEIWEQQNPDCKDCLIFSEKIYNASGVLLRTVDILNNGEKLVNDYLSSNEEASTLVKQEKYQFDDLKEIKTWNGDSTKNRIIRYQSSGVDVGYAYGNNHVTKTMKDLTGHSQDRVWRISYNSDERVTEVVKSLGSVNETVQYTYFNNNKLMKVVNAVGHSSIYEYDDQGKIVSIANGDGTKSQFIRNSTGLVVQVAFTSSSGLKSTTDFIYDSYGKIDKISTPNEGVLTGFYYENGALNPFGQQVITRFDKYIKPDYVEHLLDFYLLTPTSLNTGKQTFIPDNTDQNTYDKYGRILTHTNAMGETIEYQYDAMGNVAQVTDARGVTTRYEYNGFGEKIREVSPTKGSTIFQYNEVGNLVKEERENGVVVRRSYDPINRITKQVFRQKGVDKIVFSYTYDTCQNGIGRLCHVKGNGISTKYRYNTLGQKTKISVVRDGEVKPEVTKFTYTDTGKLNRLHYPSGLIVRYHYDSQGALDKVTANHNGEKFTVADNITFDTATQHLTGLRFGNGLKTKLQYDDIGRITQLATKNRRNMIDNRRMSYDVRGNITSIIRANSPEYSRTYTYDEAGRIIDENIGNITQITYGYDGAGNRISKQIDGKVTNYSYAADANRLEKIGQKTVSFDELGNLVEDKKGKRTFEYDVTNRMVGLYKNDKPIAEYRYNAFGQRVSKTLRRAKQANDNHRSLYFSYMPDGRLLSEVGYLSRNETTFSRDYVWVGGRPVAQIERKVGKNGKVKKSRIIFIHTDHLNTPRMATNARKEIVWSWEGDAFGASLAGKKSLKNDPDGDGNKTRIRLRFPGQYEDGESGLLYNHHRDYDPKLGRYNQTDPLGLYAGINTYTYVQNNPVNYIDPLGLSSSGCNFKGCWVRDMRSSCPSGWTCVSPENFNPPPPVYIPPPLPEFEIDVPDINIELRIKSCDKGDQAAFDKLKAEMLKHIADGIHREAGGWNFSNPDGSSGSSPVRLDKVCSPGGGCVGPTLGDPSLIPSGAIDITMWHTHGLNSVSTIFSFSDYVLMQGGHPNNPMSSTQRANISGGYFMNSAFEIYFYRSGDLPNYTGAEDSSALQKQIAIKTQAASKQVLGCK